MPPPSVTIGGVNFPGIDLEGVKHIFLGLGTAAGVDAIAPILAALGLTASADDAFAITPNDGTVLNPVPKAIMVTADGTLAMRGTGNGAVSFGAVKAGQIIPFRARRVYATGTTCTVIGLV